MTKQISPTMTPAIKHYFWDVDTSQTEVTNPQWIIARLLDKGDEVAIRWVQDSFSIEEIRNTLKNSRDLSLKSASFWARIYKVPFSEVKCFQEPYRSQRATLWPY